MGNQSWGNNPPQMKDVQDMSRLKQYPTSDSSKPNEGLNSLYFLSYYFVHVF